MRIFVLGNGPSLMETPLERLEGEVSFGVNQVHLIYPYTKWRPTHMMFAEMTAGGNDWYPKIWDAVLANKHAKRFARDDAWWWPPTMPREVVHGYYASQDKSMHTLPNINRYSACTHHDIFDRDGHVYYENVPTEWHFPQICKFGGSVPMAIQLAVQEGATEIFLLGCDLGHKEGSGNHFDPRYAGHRPITEQKARERNEANKMGHEFAKASSPVPIYNATLGGSLEVYERVDFRSLF